MGTRASSALHYAWIVLGVTFVCLLTVAAHGTSGEVTGPVPSERKLSMKSRW